MRVQIYISSNERDICCQGSQIKDLQIQAIGESRKKTKSGQSGKYW